MHLVVSLRQLLFLQLTLLGTFGQKWNVLYTDSNVCALKGSSVTMNSSYTHPPNLRRVKKFWVRNPVKGDSGPDLTEGPEYSGRVQYTDSHNQTFNLKLSAVKKSDEGMFCLRITTNSAVEKYLGFPGVMLIVTDLRVEIPERVSEGNATLLRCVTSCDLKEPPTFIWYKNGRPVETRNQSLNTLYLQPTRIEHSGSYSCAVKGYNQSSSPALSLNVRYSPRNISVSISPSGGIVEGSSVNLSCSSDAYPPVENYTWFKATEKVGQGSTYTISNFRSEDRGEYKCKCSNADGVRYSAGVTLEVVGELSKGQQAVIGVLIFFAVLSFAVVLVLLRWKKKCCWSEEQTLKQDNIHSDGCLQTPAKNAPQPKTGSVSQDDCQYASIVHKSAKGLPVKASSSRTDEDVQYAIVQHCHKKPVEKTQEEDVQYASVTFHQSHRPAKLVQNDSAIYSAVK